MAPSPHRPAPGDAGSARALPLARRLGATVLALLVVVAGALALTARPAAAGPVDDEARLFSLTNQSRAAAGLAPLAYDPAAVSVARGWAAELARSGQLRHNPNLVAQVDAHVTNRWTRVGENVGYSATVDQVHGAYMASPGHRANILGDFNRVGVGAAYDATGRLWTTVVFIKGPALGNQNAALVDTSAIDRLYLAYFRRRPDAAGRQYWIGRLLSGTGLGQISAAFAASPEFVGTYGLLDDRGFVELVYRNVLGRAPDAQGLFYWVAQLGSGRLDRGGVMVNFSESPEFKAITGTG